MKRESVQEMIRERNKERKNETKKNQTEKKSAKYEKKTPSSANCLIILH
jgi:hypothetical protein